MPLSRAAQNAQRVAVTMLGDSKFHTTRPTHTQQAGALALDVGWTPEAHVTASIGGSTVR